MTSTLPNMKNVPYRCKLFSEKKIYNALKKNYNYEVKSFYLNPIDGRQWQVQQCSVDEL